MTTLKYRPDIDCLRALAVVSVIGYHFNIPPFRSGFIGVDIFFVISGFLITGIIHADVEAGEFSFLRFYARRARRILPALYVVVAATMAFAYLCLPPLEYVGLAEQSLSVIAFCSNILFWMQHGYFDGASITKPLLQTWSLSVEEQFYFLFPAIIVWIAAIWRSRPYVPVLFGIFAASLALCIFQTASSPAAAFYLLPARAWEFALGALIAVGGFPSTTSMRLRGGAAIAGWIILGVSVNVFVPTSPYPGANALLPCAGAALVIWSAIPAGRFIALLRPLLFIGLISYSLYLWHWPIAVFSDLIFGPQQPPILKLALIATCFVISVASYYFVEQPFRQPSTKLRTIAIGAACVASGSMPVILTNGFENRLTQREASIARYSQYDPTSAYSMGRCFVVPHQQWNEHLCLNLEDKKQNVLVWGDSYAAHLVHGLKKANPEAHFMQATMSGCVPVLEPYSHQKADCNQFNNSILRSALSLKPDAIIVSSAWTDPSLEAGVAELLKILTPAKIPVIVIGPTPRYDTAFPRIYLSQILVRRWYARPQTRLAPDIFSIDEKLSQTVSAFPDVRYISPLSKLCHTECPTFVGDVPVTWDAGHLTTEGSELVARAISPDMGLERMAKPIRLNPGRNEGTR